MLPPWIFVVLGLGAAAAHESVKRRRAEAEAGSADDLKEKVAELEAKLDAALADRAEPGRIETLEAELEAKRQELKGLRAGAEARETEIERTEQPEPADGGGAGDRAPTRDRDDTGGDGTPDAGENPGEPEAEPGPTD